jgi:2-methylcitrate dehydratase PrpD
MYGSVRLAAFTPERLKDPKLRQLMSKIYLFKDPVLDSTFPGQRAARVSLTTRGNQREEYLQPTRIGDPDHPLSDTDLSEKFMELVAPTFGDAESKRLLEVLWAVDACNDLEHLIGKPNRG